MWPIDNSTVWVVGYFQLSGIAARFTQGQWMKPCYRRERPRFTACGRRGRRTCGRSAWGGQCCITTAQLDAGVDQRPAPTQVLSGVGGTPDGEVWVVGAGGTVLHGTKSGLSPETSSVTTDLTSVWGAGNTEVWAVGSRGTAIRRNATGGTWSAQNHGLTQNVLYSVWLSSRTDVWAVGDRVTLHYDGSGWVAVPNPLEIGISVWGSADDDVWSVGRPATASGTPFISRFNGVAWVPTASPTNTPLQSVRGSSFGNVWAVGNGGVVLHLQ